MIELSCLIEYTDESNVADRISACQGDSGGPMAQYKDDESREAQLIGIVSWGKGCADRRYPGVYARVQEAREWILRVTGI